MQCPERTAAGAVETCEHMRGTMRHPDGIFRVENEEGDEAGHDNRSGQGYKRPPRP